MKNKIYIFGLGNTGDKYNYTRHNAARVFLSDFDFFKNILSLKCNNNQNILFDDIFEIFYIEPPCYMNQSGIYIKEYLKNKNINIKDSVIIVYDDKDIDLGKIKNSFARSGGGHNGVKSIIENLQTKDFFCIRIGIRPISNHDYGQDSDITNQGKYSIKNIKNSNYIDCIKDFVIQPFTKQEIKVLKSPDFVSIFSQNLIQILKQIRSNISS